VEDRIMTAAVFDLDAIRKRLNELGVTTVAGNEFPKKECHMRAGKGWNDCWCRRADGSFDPCPKED
jgi:hypothetical protein